MDPIHQDEDVDRRVDDLRGVAMHEGDATSVEKPSGAHDAWIDVVAEPSRGVNVGQQVPEPGTNLDDRAGRQSIDDVDDDRSCRAGMRREPERAMGRTRSAAAGLSARAGQAGSEPGVGVPSAWPLSGASAWGSPSVETRSR